MPCPQIGRAELVTIVGWLLTANALLGALAVITTWQSVGEFGGRYPPALLFFLMFPLLAVGGSVTLYGARQIGRELLLLFPASVGVVMVYMIQFILCVPWEQCVVP